MLENTSDEHVRSWGGYGDHLSTEETPAELSDTAWCAHSADLLSRMAQVLGKEEDAARYRQMHEKFKQAWQEHFVTEDGMAEDAYQMLLQEEYPSLLYLIGQGATTTWENPKGYIRQENGYFLYGSLNHYANGAPAAWLYTDVLGIKSDAEHPGYRHFYLEPKPGGNLDFAEGSYISPYGKIAVRWEKTGSGYHYFVQIPANTTATLTLQGHPQSGSQDGTQTNLQEGEVFRQELVSGVYEFTME